MQIAGEVIAEAGVVIDVIDAGGGFPVAYPDVEPPPLGAFIAEIEAGGFDTYAAEFYALKAAERPRSIE